MSARLFCPAQFITAPIALSKYSESSSYCFATKTAFSLIGVERLTLAIALSTDTSENSVVSAGVSVTSGVGVSLGDALTSGVGVAVASAAGASVGSVAGASVGAAVGASVGCSAGASVGCSAGASVGCSAGASVGS